MIPGCDGISELMREREILGIREDDVTVRQSE